MNGIFRHRFIPPPPSNVIPFSLVTADIVAPTLSSPLGTETSLSTATGSVYTNEGNGTLYWVVTTAATSPSVAQIQLGQDHLGNPAVDSGNQAVSIIGTQNAFATGLSSSTTYYFHFQHIDTATNNSTVASSAFFILRAPTLDTQSASATGSSTGEALVDTDETGGTLYWVVTQFATQPSALHIESGLDHLGNPADAAGSSNVVASGTQGPFSATSLNASTTYYFHLIHADAASLNSNIVTTNSFTTSATADTTPPVLTSPTSENSGAGSVTTDEGNGVLYWVVTQSATAPSIAQIQSGLDHVGLPADDAGQQAVDSTGVRAVFSSGLVVSTVYYFHFQQQDAATNDSTVVSSASFTQAAITGIPGSLGLLGVGR